MRQCLVRSYVRYVIFQPAPRSGGSGSVARRWATEAVDACTHLPRLARYVAIVYLCAMPMRPGVGSATPSAASSPASSTVSVILVGGGRDQLSEPAAARDLYVSPLFGRRRARAEASGVPWFVVSGRWGLLDPGDVLAPYSFSLAEQSVNYQRAWGRFVAEQLSLVSSVGRGDVVEICAGAVYAAALTAPIEFLGARVRRTAVGASDAGDEPR